MSSNSKKNSRIAKNALFLYLRSIVVLLIALYTTRVVLATLGVEDYGIYYVVGGVVAIFSSISSSMTGAISRFLTFELGREDKSRLKTVFFNGSPNTGHFGAYHSFSDFKCRCLVAE